MRFEIIYKETDTYRATFTADSKEQAEEMIRQAVQELGNLSELPDFDSVGIDYEMTYNPDLDLREVVA